ncbi:hypothetical protein [Geobacter pickeringii]|uniref:Uncharacterized protein n=1 Tax=Geobacter pickeringii TaxID=345632 RepID=A0A0B5BCP5_9BACT|nr:hypothetical protein [Geobacter pickeringii]AJE04498.1 hypothetical protein GPICK_15025 [Geobacter pickeringii]
MGTMTRLRVLATVAVNAVVPATKKGGVGNPASAHPGTPVPPGRIPVSPAAISACLAHPESYVDGGGNLSLFFCDAPALAAPFLLFRLKRLGFSRCRAAVHADGIVLTARR